MTPGLSFGLSADLYDSIRPSYPPQALEWALGPAPRTVLDLGAGTGILTRVLLTLGHHVLAVEPDEAMRAKLARTTPGVAVLPGRAEAIPVPDGQVDAVVAGQAYHWFDPEPTHREVARVLRDGGVFAPVWNVRDHHVAWVWELTVIADSIAGRADPQGSPADRNLPADRDLRSFNGELDHDFGAELGPVERGLFRHEVPMTADRLVKLVASRSYYITATPEKQAEIEAAVRELAATLPKTFTLPYITVVYRATRCARR
jgi:SAM-dependent methyltransferase